MEWWLSSGFGRLLIRTGGPSSAGKEAVPVNRAPERRLLLAPFLKQAPAMHVLRSIVSGGLPAEPFILRSDAQVLDEIERRLADGRLHLHHRRDAPSRIASSGNGGAPPPTPRTDPADSAPVRRSAQSRALRSPSSTSGSSSSATTADVRTRPAGGGAGVAALAAAAAAVLSFYEVLLMDEIDDPIEGVTIELDTPAGRQSLVTDASGKVRVDQVPPGTGSARIASPDELAKALEGRSEGPKRRRPLPDPAADLTILTPRRAAKTVTFPDARTQRIMIVSRTDVIWGSVGDPRQSYGLRSEDVDVCRVYEDEDATILQVCSTAEEVTVVLGPPPLMPLEPPEPSPLPVPIPNPLWIPPATYIYQLGDTLPDLAYNYLGDGDRWAEIWAQNEGRYPGRLPGALAPGETLVMPPGAMPGWMAGDATAAAAEPQVAAVTADPSDLRIDIDPLHEALFDEDFATVEEMLMDAFEEIEPAPLPAWPPPVAERLDYSNEMLKLALEGYFDWPGRPDDPV